MADRARYSLHVAPYPRRLAHPLPVLHLGHLPSKTYWVDWNFEFIAFSIVLAGTGTLHVDGRRFDIRGPLVICEYPGPRFRYGPEESWDELFINYHRSHEPLLMKIGLLRKGRFVWPIHGIHRVKRIVDELGELARQFSTPGMLDRIDRLSEALIAETLIAEEASDELAPLLAIRSHFEAHYTEPIDYRTLARAHGLSFTTFRRQWTRHMGVGPGKFVKDLRMKHACRLLCESEQPISEIALDLGFSDPLYFSKAFHREIGETAGSYRRRYRMGLERR